MPPPAALGATTADAVLNGSSQPKLDHRRGWFAGLVFLLLLAGGIGFSGFSLVDDVTNAGGRMITLLPCFLLGIALLIAAIIWNLGTWWLGLPASSSHTLIGSIIGVALANAMMHGHSGTSGVDWTQATKVGYSLPLSPLIGFACAALLLLALRARVNDAALYTEPQDQQPPPWRIRGLQVLTLPAAIVHSGTPYWLFTHVF